MPNLIFPRSLPLVAVAACLLTPFLAESISAQTSSLSAQRFLQEHPALTVPAQADRVLAGASMAERAQFPGHVAPFAKETSRNGAPAADAPLSLTALLNRSPAVQAAFEDLLAKQQDPVSPLYHQWLTPAQVGSLYGPTQNDVNAVVSWLASAGFTVESVDPSRTRIHFTTTFGAAASAFKTSFGTYAVGTGTLYSVKEEPTLPSALSGVLGAVVGLSEVKVFSTIHQGQFDPAVYGNYAGGVRPLYTGSSGTHYLAPGDFNTIYDLTSVLNAGFNGSGQRIAIVGQSQVITADISRYETLFGLPSNLPNVVIPTNGADPGVVASGDQDEQTLDVERVVATAQGATVDLVVSKQVGSNSGLGIAIDWNVNTLVDKVMSISYGTCESQYSASDAASDNSYFSQAASEGITTVISSGDSGVLGCSGFTSSSTTVQNTPAINGLCGSQYVTCVGGTEFSEGTSSAYWSSSNGTYLTSALGYIPEGAWNESAHPNSTNSGTTYSALGTGGGPSAYIAKPSWQTGTGVPADGKRDVPDISFTSAVYQDGYLVCINTSAACAPVSGGGLAVFGGTSAAAPGMAGIMAILNQKSGNTTGYGNLNPLLYTLAASSPSAFHDTTVTSSGITSCVATTPSLCNNSTPGTSGLSGGVAGYLVNAGYDEATGLGSLDVANFFAAAISSTTVPYSLTANPATLTFTTGATSGNTSKITVTASSSFSGAVALACTTVSSGTVNASCTVNPAAVTLTAGGTATATVTIAGSTGNGVLTATITGTNGTSKQTAKITANISVPAFTLTPTSTSLPLTAGATTGNTNVFTVASVNNFTGVVNLACAVALSSGTAPLPPTCSLSSSSATLTAGGSTTSTVTIGSTATTNGCLSSNTVPIIGSKALEITLAGLLFLALPFRRRRAVRGLMALGILAFGLSTLSGCGSGGSSGTSNCTVVIAGTTKGTYTVTVTGTGTSTGASSAATSSNTFTLTVN